MFTLIRLVLLFLLAMGLGDIPAQAAASNAKVARVVLNAFPAHAGHAFPPASAKADETKAVADASLNLAADLYAKAGAADNFVYAPFDIIRTYAMLAAGAGGSTLSGLLDETQTGLPESRLHPALRGVAASLLKRGQAGGLRLDTALWGQGHSQARGAAYRFSRPFLKTLFQDYDAALQAVDFTDPNLGALADSINAWIGERDGGILNMVNTASLNGRTRMIQAISSALDGAWQQPPNYDPALEGRFELLDHTHILTPMLEFSGRFNYAAGDGYQAFELPLAGSGLALLVIMPEHDRFMAIRLNFNAPQLQAILADLAPTELTVHLPKIDLETYQALSNGIRGTLAQSGAFVENVADFSKANGIGFLYLASLEQRAGIHWQERGVKAGAAAAGIHWANQNEPDQAWGGAGLGITGISIGTNFFNCQYPYYDPTLALARPFLFALRDRGTGTILATGQAVTPAGAPAPPDRWIDNCPSANDLSAADAPPY
jgi:serpin B